VYFTVKRLRIFLFALLALQIATCICMVPIVRSRFIDFRTFYTAGYMVHMGHASALYDYDAERRWQSQLIRPDEDALPFMSPPFTALPFALLAFTSAPVAYVLFGCLNLTCLGFAVRLMRPYLGALSARWQPLPLLLFASFLPVGAALMFGQLSIVLLLLYCACFAALESKRPFLAGLILSLALVKFQVALPVAFFCLIWRQWRFIAGFVAGAAGLLAVSLAMVGPHILLTYPNSLAHMTASATTAAAQRHFAIIPWAMPNLYGFFYCISGGHPWGKLLTAVVSVAVLIWTVSRKPSLPVAMLGAILNSYHFFLYDACILLLPLSLLINEKFAQTEDATPRETLWRGSGRSSLWVGAAGVLLCAPVMRIIIANDLVYLLAVPVALLSIGAAGQTSATPYTTAGVGFMPGQAVPGEE
jgi:hypothetical protein